MKQPPEPVKPWRDVLHESFDHVQATGGLFALDFEYYLESEGNRCYRLLWTNRLDAETISGRLIRHEGGVVRKGPVSETLLPRRWPSWASSASAKFVLRRK